MRTFPIVRYKRIRRRTDYIILVPSTCFRENFYITPLVEDSGDKYTWGIWEYYFYHDLQKEVLPCHYFTERIGEDFTNIVGLSEFHPSYFIEDLVQAGIVDYRFIHSIIISVGCNFNRYPVDKRFSMQITNKILDPLLRKYDLSPDRIKFIDECYKENWQESLENSTLQYKLEESKYFDMNQLTPFIHRYKNYK